MRRNPLAWLALVGGICLAIFGQSGTVYSQDDDNEYVGTRECRSCHRSYANDHAESPHGRTLIEIAELDDDEDSPILGDFDVETEALTVEVDGESRTFTADDVLFTLGAGRKYQAYVTDVDGVLKVLPAQWSVDDEMWVSLALGESWADDAYHFSQECAACHTTNFDVDDFTWMESGVQCETCHGMGLTHVELADDAGSSVSDDEYVGISTSIHFGLDSQTCGQCHVRGTNEETGLPFPVGYHPGGDLLDESVFTPAPTDNDEVWFDTVHASAPNMQYNEWLQSSHPNALASAQEADGFEASCLGCHSVAQRRIDYLIEYEWVDEDEFDRLSVLDEHGFGITCASCHNPHEEDNDVYLVNDDTYALCTSCHSDSDVTEGLHHPVQEMYEGQTFVEEIDPIAGAHFSAENAPTCMTCHMQAIDTKNGTRNSHTFHPVSPAGAADIANLQDACTTCHTDIEDPVAMQTLIDSVQSNVGDRLSTVSDALDSDSPEWAAQVVAAIEGDGSMGVHNYAYTNAMLQRLESELGIVSGTVSDADIVEQLSNTLPVVEATPIPPPEPIVPPVRGLTQPSIVLLGIMVSITAFAAAAFFLTGGDDD